MTDASALLKAFAFQQAANAALGSPFTARVLGLVADDIAAGGPFADIMRPWMAQDERRNIAEATPLRILGGLQDLVLAGRAPALAAVWAAKTPDETLRKAIVVTGEAFEADLIAFITSPPQTNEVRRSLCLVGGFLTVAAETGLPLRTREMGASAGLNMSWDRFRYRFGGEAAWGGPDSPLRLDGDWSGPPPPTPDVKVIDRAACDQRPVDLEDESERRRLEAYIWADQPERLARLRAAIAIARNEGVKVEPADAADWTGRHLTPAPGAATVFYHSVVWPYLPPATRKRVGENIDRAAALATADAPFAWLRMEPGSQTAGPMEVRLTLWPGGEDRLLAEVHPHGASVRWLA